MSAEGADNQNKELQQAQRMARLIALYLQEKLSSQERSELDEWVAASDENMLLFEELTDESNLQQAMSWMQNVDQAKTLEQIKERIGFAKRERRPGPRFSPTLIAAAAVITAIIAGAIYFFNGDRQALTNSVEYSKTTDELLPGSKRAVLIAGAKRIDLAGVKDSSIQVGGNLTAFNKNNILKYSSAAAGPVELNTLQTPEGGEYQVELPDGSRVWLNAVSSLTYPTRFAGATRTVELTGEAYFEVAKKGNPFIVKTGRATVEVLGTHFNIEAYTKALIKTTLLEGSVKISQDQAAKILRPAEQGIITPEGINVIKDIEVEEATAWTHGFFAFSEDSISSVMNQVARWYGLQVEYKGKIDQLFTGKIRRSSTAAQVFRMLEVSGEAHFIVNGKKVTVQPL